MAAGSRLFTLGFVAASAWMSPSIPAASGIGPSGQDLVDVEIVSEVELGLVLDAKIFGDLALGIGAVGLFAL